MSDLSIASSIVYVSQQGLTDGCAGLSAYIWRKVPPLDLDRLAAAILDVDSILVKKMDTNGIRMKLATLLPEEQQPNPTTRLTLRELVEIVEAIRVNMRTKGLVTEMATRHVPLCSDSVKRAAATTRVLHDTIVGGLCGLFLIFIVIGLAPKNPSRETVGGYLITLGIGVSGGLIGNIVSKKFLQPEELKDFV